MGFRGNTKLRGHREEYTYSEEQLAEYMRCRDDFEYWVERYAKVATLDDGIVTIKLRGYQRRMVRTIKALPSMKKRGMVVLAPRQCGKTTAIYLYILWLVIFHEYKRVAIIANKGAGARKIVRDIKQAYEFLPIWMQPGIKQGGWNKGQVELENGSIIASGSTTSDSIRGMTFHCVAGDSEAVVRTQSGTVYKTTVRELHQRGDEQLEVLTSSGWKPFDGCALNGTKITRLLTLTNGLSVRTTDDHRIETARGWVELQDLTTDDQVCTQQGLSAVVSVSDPREELVYDLVNVEDVHCFYANGISVHNCVYCDEYGFINKNLADEFMKSVLPTIMAGKTAQLFATSTPKGMNHFWRMWRKAEAGLGMFAPVKVDYMEIPAYADPAFKQMIIETEGLSTWNQEFANKFLGSSKTLINADTLERMALKLSPPPIAEHFDGKLKIWELPRVDATYITSVDSSKGVGGDNAVVHVLRIDGMHKCEQVATFADNYTPINDFAQICVSIARYYYESEIIVENNDLGGVLCERIFENLGYDRLVSYEKDYFGVRSSKKSKAIGNIALREYVESGWVKLNDEETIKEFSFYEEIHKDVFGAITGEHDDRVMALMWGLYFLRGNSEYEDEAAAQINPRFRLHPDDERAAAGMPATMGDGDADWMGGRSASKSNDWMGGDDGMGSSGATLFGRSAQRNDDMFAMVGEDDGGLFGSTAARNAPANHRQQQRGADDWMS